MSDRASIFHFLLQIVVLTAIAVKGYAADPLKLVEVHQTHMGMPVHLRVYAPDEQVGRDACRAAFDGIKRTKDNKHFHVFRTILVSPTRACEIVEEMKKQRPEANFEFVDPYTFFKFLKIAVENGDTY